MDVNNELLYKLLSVRKFKWHSFSPSKNCDKNVFLEIHSPFLEKKMLTCFYFSKDSGFFSKISKD